MNRLASAGPPGATLQIDLGGACNSEHRLGRQYSGSGGSSTSPAAPALRRVLPRLQGPVTTPRNHTHIVVTEFGWADLKGKSLGERAEALIGIAHPRLREERSRAIP